MQIVLLMHNWFIDMAAVFTGSLICVSLFIPLIISICNDKGLFDAKSLGRGQNIPRLGGVTFLPVAVLAVMSVADVMDMDTSMLYGGLGMLLIFIIGIIDDVKGLDYNTKLIVQSIGVLMVISGGVCNGFMGTLCGMGGAAPYLGFVLSMVLMLLIINAMNLIDGIDGLASMMSLLPLGVFAWISYLDGDYIGAVLSVAFAGTVTAFLYYNLSAGKNSHSRIFMGDTGSLTIGFVLAFLTMRICRKASLPGVFSNMHPLWVAFSVLSVPSLDAVRVFLERLLSGTNPFLSDRRHVHYMLQDIGMGAHAVLALLSALSATFALCGILAARYVDVSKIISAEMIAYAVLTGILHKIRTYHLSSFTVKYGKRNIIQEDSKA